MKKILLLAVVAVVALAITVPAVAQQKQGDKSFEVIGEVRFRGDYTDSVVDLNDSDPNDDAGTIWPWRVRAGFHGKFSRNVSAHIEVQQWGFAGDGDNGIQRLQSQNFSGSETTVYQGWVELGNIGGSSFDLRLGRQELVFGSEMLLGDNDFYNGTNHDGLRASWQYQDWTLDTWYTELGENVGFTFTPGDIFPTGGKVGDTEFYGGYATFKAPKNIGFDVYGFLRNDNFDGSDFGDLCGLVGPPVVPCDLSAFPTQEQRWTFGGRVYSKYDSNWSWSAEVAWQTGEFESVADLDPGTAGIQNTIDISSAVGFEGELAYEFEANVAPRVHGRYSLYTGNDDDGDESEAFDPLFQDVHPRLGNFDLVRATNLEAIEVGVAWRAGEDRHEFGVNLISFTLNEEIDSDPAGGFQGEDDFGTELDLYYNFAYTKHLMIQAAISSFQPGDVFDNAAPATDPMPFIQAPGGVAPDVAAIGDDNALRVYANTRLRW